MFEKALDAVSTPGRFIFSLATVAVGIENVVCARYASHTLGAQYEVIPVIPWLPAIPWLGYAIGVIFVACGVGILFTRTRRMAALVVGALMFVGALVLVAPKYAADLASMGLRTVVFEPLALASLAWLLPDRADMPGWLTRLSRYALALSLIVFGVDHFLALAPIASLIPAWIPFHLFWVAFFGAALIAAGLGFAIGVLERPAAAGMGLMFGIWVVTLHLPRVLGLYGIPGASTDPDEWSSLLIAVGLWGGMWSARFS
jgi:uncharacterized membrane protein